MDPYDKIRIAVVCSSNMNRSMEAHAFLAKKGFIVYSYGSGDKIKLPGTALDKPNVYEFGTSYEDIYNDLYSKDKSFYTQNGLLNMLERNKRIKPKPERFQDTTKVFDIIVTCEERVYDQVLDHLECKTPVYNSLLYIINIDVEDNHEDATIGAFLIRDLLVKLAECDDLDDEISKIIDNFETKCQRPILYCILFS